MRVVAQQHCAPADAPSWQSLKTVLPPNLFAKLNADGDRALNPAVKQQLLMWNLRLAHEPRNLGVKLESRLHTARYKKLLKDVCGGCQVEEQTTTQFNDFATLALAPTVFCAARWFLLAVFIKLHALGATQMASSTFCLWAGMGNPGTVYFPGEFMADGQCPEMGRPILGKWIAARDARILGPMSMCFFSRLPEAFGFRISV
ncbi:unnamed protein product [Symbiodinium microadriaticum]|nr:unnamed protein product [Symbiodinium microadriaticum]